MGTVELLRDILNYLPAVVTGLAGWLVGRGRTKAEVEQIKTQTDTTEIENSKSIVDMYKEAMNDMENRHKLKHDELTVLYEKKIVQMQDEIRSFERKHQEISEMLERKIKLLEEENGFLKLKNEEYKKEIKLLRQQQIETNHPT